MSISSVDTSPLHIKHAVDLNITAEANRILYVLNKIILRAKFVGVFEKLIKDEGLVLKNIFDFATFNFILDVLQRYNRPISERTQSIGASFSSSRASDISHFARESLKYMAREKSDDGDSSSYTSSSTSKSDDLERNFNSRNDNSLSRVISIMEDNLGVRQIAKKLEKQISPEMGYLVKTLTEFKERMGLQLNENAKQHKNKELYLRETFEKNEKAKKEIEKLEEELVVTKTDTNICLIGRNVLINRHQNKIENIQKASIEAIDKIVHESEKTMVNDWKESLIQQDQLKQDYNQAAEKYSNMLKEHLSIEKVLRGKRSKIENQVLGWIQKYDQDIGEKQAEEERIQALLDEETNQVKNIQSKIDEQEEEYDDLMQEKAEYEEEMLERRLYQFVVNRSARRIQRTFRLYKAKKLAKKLAKKGKKGKKRA